MFWILAALMSLIVASIFAAGTFLITFWFWELWDGLSIKIKNPRIEGLFGFATGILILGLPCAIGVFSAGYLYRTLMQENVRSEWSQELNHKVIDLKTAHITLLNQSSLPDSKKILFEKALRGCETEAELNMVLKEIGQK
jgi:hypothetical protein